MNTTAHILLGAAAFARPEDRRVTQATLAGAIIPDLSLFVMVGWQGWAEGRSAEQIFGHDYRDAFWQAIFAIDNSVPLWAGLLAIGLWAARPWLTALGGAGLLHVAFDLLLHREDARRQFWPLSDRVFVSPVSYWDPAHHGQLVGALVFFACVALGFLLWRRFRGGFARALIAATVALEAVPAVLFPLLFAYR